MSRTRTGGITILTVATMLCLTVAAHAQLPAQPATLDGLPDPARPNGDAEARAKLKQARALIGQGEFDSAERLAREANLTPGKPNGREDTPARVLEDVAKARRNPHTLLTASRAALKRNDFDRAEKLAQAAEQNASTLTFPLWSDSPSRVKKDIQIARAKQEKDKAKNAKLPEVTPAAKDETAREKEKSSSGFFAPVKNLFGSNKKTEKPAVQEKKPASTGTEVQVGFRAAETVKQTPKTAPSATTPADTEQARQLLVKGREAIVKGQLDTAAGYAEQARALRPSLTWSEDNPERLLRAIQDVRSRTVTSTPLVPAKTVARTIERTDRDAKEGDEPAAASQQEALTLLREGRKQLTQGKFDEVRVTLKRVRGYRAGKYGLFDDSPDKLQTDLAKARAKKDREESVHVLAEARRSYEDGDYDKASKLAFQAQQMHGPYSIWDLGDRPNKLIDEIQVGKEKKRNSAIVSGRKVSKKDSLKTDASKTEVASKSVPPSPEMEKARALLMDVHTLQMQGKLIEAKKKLAEVESLKIAFKADEVSPEMVQQQLASDARRQSAIVADRAIKLATFGEGAPSENCETAEKMLKSARELTVSFDLDPSDIDKQCKLVAAVKARLSAPVAQVSTGPTLTPPSSVGPGVPVALTPPVAPSPVAQAGPPVDPAARAQGLTLLEKSRLELRKGNLSLARRIAEEAYQGDFGVKPLAEQRLKEVDIEENNQQRLEDRRTCDAALAAFNRGDFLHARAILAGVHVQRLDEVRQARVREMMASAEMGGGHLLPSTDLAHVSPAGHQTVTDRGDGAAGSPPPIFPDDPSAGKMTITDADTYTTDLLAQTKAMRNVQFQELRAESMKAMREAGDRFAQGDAEGAVTLLQNFIAKLPEAQLDANKLAMLRKPIDNRIAKYNVLQSQNSLDRQVAGTQRTASSILSEKILREQNKQKNVGQLMKQFTEYYKQGKYHEAEMYAKMVVELDPDNPFATAAVTIARTQSRLTEDKKRKAQNEDTNYHLLQDGSGIGAYADVQNPVVINKERTLLGHRRAGDPNSRESGIRKTQAVREIEAILDKPVTINYADTPLRDVINSLHDLHDINIIPDTAALKQENISLDRPVTLKLDRVAMKSALNIILRSVDLTWVIRDNVLQVTTPAQAKEKQVRKTYLVADLVIPIEDHKTPDVFKWEKQVDRLNATNAPLRNGSPAPTPTPGSMAGGSSVGSPLGSSSQNGSGGQFASSQPGEQQQVQGGPSNAMPQQLIQLLKSSVDPNSWNDSAGPGTIDYFPLGMTLIINQTPDIQEQIADLLAQLRRLQDLEVAIEIRLISLSDNFFERMGVNFDVNIKTDRSTAPYEPQLVRGLQTGQFKPAGFVQDFSPSRFITGLTSAGTFTSDLDIPIKPTSFGLATPPFGLGSAFTGNTTGGIGFGLAFLSDIQVKFFMEAAQGDQRFNVMQAPKLVMFNGQSASLDSGFSQVFVQGVQIAAQGVAGGPLFIPNAQVNNFGTSINVQPVVTGDRRFVRVNVDLRLTNPAASVAVFPVVVTVQPFIEGVGSVGNPSILTQFIQQPVTNFINVQTTAVVPDGGTVLLGGLKRLSEGRNEFGPPILSKIPYLNRLVKNVGYGRETENILMMITPRIIINEEEEIIQTSVISSPALAQ